MQNGITMACPFGLSMFVEPKSERADNAFTTMRLKPFSEEPKEYVFRVDTDREYQVVLGYCQPGWPDTELRMIEIHIEGECQARFDLADAAADREPFVKIFNCRDKDSDGTIRISSCGYPGINAIWLFEGKDTEDIDTEALIRGELNDLAKYYVDCGNESSQIRDASRVRVTPVEAVKVPLSRPRHRDQIERREDLPLGYRDICEYLSRSYEASIDQKIHECEQEALKIYGNPALGKNADNPHIRHFCQRFAKQVTATCQRDLYDDLIWLYHDDRLGIADFRFSSLALQRNSSFRSQNEKMNIWNQAFNEIQAAHVQFFDIADTLLRSEVKNWKWSPDKIIIEAQVSSHSIIQSTTVLDDVALCEIRVKRSASGPEFSHLKCVGMIRDLSLDECVETPSIQESIDNKSICIRFLDAPLNSEELVVMTGDNVEWKLSASRDSYEFTSPVNWNESEEFVIRLAVSIGFGDEDVSQRVKSVIENPADSFKRRRKEWNDYFNYNVPQFSCPDQAYELYYYWTYYVHRANLMDLYCDKNAKHGFFAAIRKGWWSCSYGWDAISHMYPEMWLNDPACSRYIACLDKGYIWGYHALGIWKYWLRTREEGYLETAYDLLKGAESIFQEMTGDGDVLPVWDCYHWDWPCSRWDEVKPKEGKKRMLEPVKSVDKATLLCHNRQILEAIARELGLDNEADEWKRLAEKTRQRINELMWDETNGFYVDLKAGTNEKLTCKSAAAFYTLIADIPDQSQMKHLLEHLRDPKEFWTPCPVPNVSKDWPGYAPGSYVDGIVWSHCNMVIMDGLGCHGEYRLIGELLEKWIHSYVQNGIPSNIEHLNPENGAWLHMDKMGYGGILIEPIVHYLCGVSLRDNDQIEINPATLNPEWEHMDFGNFGYRGHIVDVRWRKNEGFTVHLDGKCVSSNEKPESVLIALK